MGMLEISDFAGGRNTLLSIDEIADNESPDQENTWVELKSLSKRRGYTTTVITISGLAPIPEQLKPTLMAAGSLMRLCMIGKVSAHSQRYLNYTDDGSTFAFAAYTVGTVGTTGTTTTIDGAGGMLWTQHVAIGDYFIKAGGTPNRITAINADNQLVVTSAETITAGASYQIIQKIAQGSPAGIATADVSGVQNLFIADGSRAYTYDGTNVKRRDGSGTEGYSMPLFKQLIPYKNYLFGLLHNATDIRWCALKDPTTWPSNNFQAIVASTADPVRGGIAFGNGIVIFTRSGMYNLAGDLFDPLNPTYTLNKIPVPASFNFVHSRGATLKTGAGNYFVTGGLLFFLTADGWFTYNGYSVEKASQAIQTDCDGFRQLAFAPEAMQDSSIAIEYKKRLWLSVPDDSKTPSDTDNTIYLLDENGKWWKWPTAAASAAGEFTDLALAKFGSSGIYQLMGGNTGTNKIAVLDTGNSDDGGVIGGGASGAYWKSKEFVFENDVDFIMAEVTMKKQSAGNLTFSFSIDRRTFVDFTCDMTAGAGTVIRKRIPIARVGKAIQFKVANAVAAQTFEIFRIAMEYDESEAQRT